MIFRDVLQALVGRDVPPSGGLMASNAAKESKQQAQLTEIAPIPDTTQGLPFAPRIGGGQLDTTSMSEKEEPELSRIEAGKSATELMLREIEGLPLALRDTLDNLATISSKQLRESINKDRETLDFWMRLKGTGQTELHIIPTAHGAKIFDALSQDKKNEILKQMPEPSSKAFLEFASLSKNVHVPG